VHLGTTKFGSNSTARRKAAPHHVKIPRRDHCGSQPIESPALVGCNWVARLAKYSASVKRFAFMARCAARQDETKRHQHIGIRRRKFDGFR